MATSSLFRRSALLAKRQQLFGPVSVVVPPSAGPLLLVVLVAVLLLVAAVSLIEVPDRVRATGVLLPESNVLEVRAPRAGWVRQLDVANGIVVRGEQTLMVISDSAGATARNSALGEHVRSLENELRLHEESLQQDLQAIEQAGVAHRIRRQALSQNLEELRRSRETRELITRMQARRAERVAKLATSSAVARQSADEHEIVALLARSDEQKLQREVRALQTELQAIDTELSQEMLAAAKTRTQALIRKEALQRELFRTRAEISLPLLAPVPGQVVGLAVTNGSFIQTGQLLLTLYQPASRIEVRLYVPASQAGRIRPGQQVDLKLDAFPHQIYGTRTVEVTAVSAVALLAEEVDARIALRGPVFEVRASAVPGTADALIGRLPPGTVVHADILRHRWPLLRWLLRSRRDKSMSV